jgi:hypothetical protein
VFDVFDGGSPSPFGCQQGTFEKYPELALPLFFISLGNCWSRFEHAGLALEMEALSKEMTTICLYNWHRIIPLATP